ncbi:YecA family protein [Nonlabens xiamenensis]|uniref:YecA family protein n=1 Tax=Nonlabens xiamenensis TaxID=2341043 RepID=UPI001981BAB8|nr:SEC-C metal-binding domain-containing protein [Nonlabens xiamenensis]
MSKIGRNDPCPCGSGKKNKRCCIGKIDNKINKPSDFTSFLKVNNTLDLLKTISLLQLIPTNHSKIVRLEIIQDTIVKSLNSINGAVSYENLQSVVHENFEYDYREDPSESSFTENITFLNGNNTVFTGIAHESTNANQCLLNSIFFPENGLSDSVKTKIKEGALFLLHTFDEIAKKLGYDRYIFEEHYRERITFPNRDFVEKNKNLFLFSAEYISEVYRKFEITENIIEEFTLEPIEVREHRGEETILVSKPFVKIDGNYYLALPTAQTYSLNQFIIRVAKEYGELEQLKTTYDKIIRNEVGKYLSAYWKYRKVDIGLKQDETIWQFDNNKFAYVCYLSCNKIVNVEKRANRVIKLLKRTLDIHDAEFFAVHLFSPFDLKQISTFAFETIKEAKYQIPLGVFDLERIFTYWNVNSLTLWKYSRARERAEQQNLKIAPFFSILTYFKWYKRNKDSFFPTDEKAPDWLTFDFAMQGEVVIESNKKSDKHFIQFIDDDQQVVYLPVIKTETYAPIYTSEDIFNGRLRVALEKYAFPIWLNCENPFDFFGKNFIEAILYWLNELYDSMSDFLSPLGEFPVNIILVFDDEIKEYTNEELEESVDKEITIGYNINPKIREMKLKIPKEIFNVLHRQDNYGEQVLMSAVFKGFNNLLKLYGNNGLEEYDIESLIYSYMPLSDAKMILTANSDRDIKLNGDFIPRPRYVYDSDIALILEENTNWLGSEKSMPSKINNKSEKEELCIRLIDSLINQIRLRLKEFNSTDLLKYLLLRHESLLHKQGERDLGIAARIKCFSKYEDVLKSYSDFNTKLIKSSHAIRCLIEFVVAEQYEGNSTVNDDDTDFLIALMVEVINYGVIKDSIKFDIDNPDMGLLESGRIGVSHGFYDDVLTRYRDSVTRDEIVDYEETFKSKFKTPSWDTSNKDSLVDEYYKKVDNIFIEEWGISLPMINAISVYLSELCFQNSNSYYSCNENEIMDVIRSNFDINEGTIKAYLDCLTLKSRGKFDQPENPKDFPEIFPWRYNRKLSYIRRPILRIGNDSNGYKLFWSARHLVSATDNLIYLFHNGRLKVDRDKKKLSKLLSERNKLKGDEFREEVYLWLALNTTLEVVEYEVKIKEKGLLKADKNYGDIDILAFDTNRKIIYAIECKNTKQVKIMYDFHNDLKNYVQKQIPKHIRRGNWLNKNTEQVINGFNLSKGNWSVESLVISSYQLPIKFMSEIPIPVYSLNEIKRENIFDAKGSFKRKGLY